MDDDLQADQSPLTCSRCSQNVTTEPTSVKCDYDSCHRIFHPSCLGNTVPLDNKRWFCDSHDSVIQDDNCGICHTGQGNRKARWIQCDSFSTWYYISCVGVSVKQYEHIEASWENGEWNCQKCKSHGRMDPNRLKWGEYENEAEINAMIENVNSEIVTWDK